MSGPIPLMRRGLLPAARVRPAQPDHFGIFLGRTRYSVLRPIANLGSVVLASSTSSHPLIRRGRCSCGLHPTRHPRSAWGPVTISGLEIARYVFMSEVRHGAIVVSGDSTRIHDAGGRPPVCLFRSPQSAMMASR